MSTIEFIHWLKEEEFGLPEGVTDKLGYVLEKLRSDRRKLKFSEERAGKYGERSVSSLVDSIMDELGIANR
jgi:hypothetical protein